MGTRFIGNKKDFAFRVISILLLTSLFIITLDSDLRSNVRSMLRPNYRVVLAVASADLTHSGVRYQVLKVKTGDGLFLEVYEPKSNGSLGIQQNLVAEVQLPDKKDGYFTFNGEVTNLAIDDINNDKKLEILTTSFDSDLVAHLNVYSYIPGHRQLEMVHIN